MYCSLKYWVIVLTPPLIYVYYEYVYSRRVVTNTSTINDENNAKTFYISDRIKRLVFDCILSTIITSIIGWIVSFILKEG